MYRSLALLMVILWIATAMWTSGCDEHAADIAREAANRQAQQNVAMAELHKEVAIGTKRLVEADAQARKEVIGVHRELQSERARLDSGWDELEQERRQIAGQRRTESLLVPVGGILLMVVLLGFCWHAIVAARTSNETSAELNELLIAEILPDKATHIASPGPPATLLGHSRPNAQPGN